MPYGGTVDGVNYLFAGLAPLTFNPLVQIASANVDVQTGAVIDLRGGGTLSGAAFIAGRGGSADVNRTPLLQTGIGHGHRQHDRPGLRHPAGHAIVSTRPSRPAMRATPPRQPRRADHHRAGEVPGLAAGTYTLLPAYYDLLPGAFRVELTGTPMAAGTSGPFGNFTTEAAVTLGTANTGIARCRADRGADHLGRRRAPALPIQRGELQRLRGGPGRDLRRAAAAAAAGRQDADPVDINTPDAVPADDQPVSIGAASLLQTAPTGGYGATLEISALNPLEILGPGDAAVPVPTVSPSGGITLTIEPGFGLDADMLSALDLPRLVIGGTLSANSLSPDIEDVQGVAPAVLVASHADLTAGDIMLTADA